MTLMRLVVICMLLFSVSAAWGEDNSDKILVIGSEQNFPPFALGLTDAEAAGFTVALWKEVAREAHIDYVIRVRPWGQVLQEFRDGKIDVLINVAQSGERSTYTDFSVPHVTVHGAIFVRSSDKRIRTENDLADKSIIVFKSDLAHEYARTKGWEKQLVIVDTVADGLRLLASGRHDAMLVNKLAGLQTVSEQHIENIKVLPAKAGFAHKFSFGVHKGDAQLLARLNEGLALTKASGKYDQLYQRWFGVYESKERTVRDIGMYLLPVVLLFACLGGYTYYRRRLERKAAEHALKESAQRLQLATQAARLGIWDWNIVDNTMEWDARMLELYGMTADSFPGGIKAWEQGLHPDDKGRALDECNTALNGHKAFDIQFRLLHPDGTVKHIKADGLVIRDEQGKAIRMIGINQDVSERTVYESEIKRLAALLKESQHIAHIGGWELDLQTNSLYWSDETYLIHDTSPADYSPTLESGIEFYTVESRPIITAAVQNAIQNGEGFTLELELVTAIGRRILVYTTCKVVQEHGKSIRVIGAFQDITERRKLEEQLRQSLKMESIGRLAGGVAHDFNNKLTVILGYAQLLKYEFPDNAHIQEQLNEITLAAEHSRDITAQLLTFSRQQVITPKSVNPNAVIADSSRTLPRLIGEDIHLEYDLSKDLWDVKIDPTQMDQIIINLAVNARDAMPNGGEFKITTANVVIDEARTWEHIDARPGEYVKITFIDSGHGMDKETCKHIFEPFYTTKELGKGTGLGLATIYGIVTQNNGFITVYSKPGVGTKIKIHLPRLKEQLDAPAPEKQKLVKGSGSVLLVEDDYTVRKLTARMLEQLGYAVFDTDSPFAAVRHCEQLDTPVDFIVTDVVMPGMNGKEMSDVLKKIRPGVKILYMSGYSAEIMSEKGVCQGEEAFIHKPFDLEALHEKIRMLRA